MAPVQRRFDITRALPRLTQRLRRSEADGAGKALSEQEPWHEVGGIFEPVFGAGFSNTGGGDMTAGFMLDTIGFVHLKGFINTPATPSGQTIFTLPAGYRPGKLLHVIGAQSAGQVSRYNIAADGTISWAGGTGTGTTSALDGITFLAEG